jgi:hypothetical protein
VPARETPSTGETRLVSLATYVRFTVKKDHGGYEMQSTRRLVYILSLLLLLSLGVAIAAGPTGAIFTTTPDGAV